MDFSGSGAVNWSFEAAAGPCTTGVSIHSDRQAEGAECYMRPACLPPTCMEPLTKGGPRDVACPSVDDTVRATTAKPTLSIENTSNRCVCLHR